MSRLSLMFHTTCVVNRNSALYQHIHRCFDNLHADAKNDRLSNKAADEMLVPQDILIGVFCFQPIGCICIVSLQTE